MYFRNGRGLEMISHNSHPHPLPYRHKTWWVGSQLYWESAYQSMLSSTYRVRYNIGCNFQ